jgi:transcriptional regulator with PAS, ATPase and Fis domain
MPKNEVKSVFYDDIMNNEKSQVLYANQNHEKNEESCEMNEDKERVQSCLYEIISENDYEVINFDYENIEISKSNETMNKIYDDTLLNQPIYTVILP